MYPLSLTTFTATSCLGSGLEPTIRAIREGKSGLTHCRIDEHGFETFVGEVAQVNEQCLPADWSSWDCRNNRLAWLALNQDGFRDSVARAVGRHGARRVGLFVGTSTSSIRETEIAFANLQPDGRLPDWFRYRQTHACFSVAEFTRRVLGIAGPAVVISTACSSSAKVFPAAARFIRSGLIDAAVVGGVDTLCKTTLYGFRSLELTSAEPCRPYDARRSGISIGEAGAFALLERPSDSRSGGSGIVLIGAGESSDAYHMSTPHPEGLGAQRAIEAALASARLAPADIGYVNLHGTGTRTNDAAEDKAVVRLFGTATPCSSTKGVTGHTLGAAGAMEAIIGALAIQTGTIPGGVTTGGTDPELHCHYVTRPREARLRHVLSNSFGFGGSNCALILGAARP